jgi:hypothetical protein
VDRTLQNRLPYPICLGILELFEGCGARYEASDTFNVPAEIEMSCLDVSTATGVSVFQTVANRCQIHHEADGSHF